MRLAVARRIRHHPGMRIPTPFWPATLLATALLSSALPATAQRPAQIGAAQALALCPVVGQPGLRFGAPRSAQDATLLAQINQLPASFAPFTEADLDLTSWSDQLAGITYLAASPDGADNQAWGEALQDSLEAEGWVPAQRPHLAATGMMDARMYEKTVPSAQGPLTLLLQFDTPGALMLSCGDAALLERAHAEADGRLAPGTPRPKPPVRREATSLPTEAACADPKLLRVFSDPYKIDELDPAFQKLIAGSTLIAAQRRHQDRLNGWLRWRLLESGQVTQDRIWDLGGDANPGTDAIAMDLMQAMLVQLGEVAKAQEQGSPAAMCRAMVGVIVTTAQKDQADIDHWTRANSALEEEARRLGLKLD